MADNKWHLVSTFDRTQTLEEFCNSINFTIDSDEKYIYRIRDGIEATEQVKKKNWYRITIKDDDSNNVGKVATYNDDDGSWEEDSTIENETNLIPRTSYWMYGEKGDKIKGQWGSRGTRSGVMDIKSIFLSVLPSDAYTTQDLEAYQDNNNLKYDVLARVEFTGQTEHDIIYFQKNSKDRMFKKFEEAFNETKNVDDKVSFEFKNKDYYYMWDYSIVVDHDVLFPVDRNSNINKRVISNDTPARSPEYTNAKEAWNALFCFEKLDSDTTILGRTGGWELDRKGYGDAYDYAYVQYADLLAIKE